MRRSKRHLEESIAKTNDQRERALAYYNLGLFHDNNGREEAAIPNYVEALRLGLDQDIEAKALAWLSSSLYKTGKPERALERLIESFGIATDVSLQRFLIGLQKRIKRRLTST